jgi:hypothetical protein
MTVNPVAGEIHDEAGLGESLLEILTGLGFVFDDQNLHSRCLLRSLAHTLRRRPCQKHDIKMTLMSFPRQAADSGGSVSWQSTDAGSALAATEATNQI